MQMPGHFFTILRVAVNGERVEKLYDLHRIYCSLRRSYTFAEVLHLAGMPQTRAEAQLICNTRRNCTGLEYRASWSLQKIDYLLSMPYVTKDDFTPWDNMHMYGHNYLPDASTGGAPGTLLISASYFLVKGHRLWIVKLENSYFI